VCSPSVCSAASTDCFLRTQQHAKRVISALLCSCRTARPTLVFQHDPIMHCCIVISTKNPNPQNRYVNNVIGRHTADDPSYNGVFIDGPLASSELCCSPNMTLASKRSMLVGLATMLKKTSDLLSPAGKVLTASLGSHFSNLTSRFYPPNSTAGGTATTLNPRHCLQAVVVVPCTVLSPCLCT
jgi:hypothetical protein